MNRFMEFLYKVVEMLLVLGHTYVAKGKFSLGVAQIWLRFYMVIGRQDVKVPQVDLVWLSMR